MVDYFQLTTLGARRPPGSFVREVADLCGRRGGDGGLTCGWAPIATLIPVVGTSIAGKSNFLAAPHGVVEGCCDLVVRGHGAAVIASVLAEAVGPAVSPLAV